MKKKTLLKIFPLALLCLNMSACLKDELYTGDTNDSPNLIEFLDAPDEFATASHIYSQFNKSFEVVPLDTFSIDVSYSGKDVAPEDIAVNLGIDKTALSNYNAKIVKDARDAAIEAGTDPDEAEAEVSGDLYDQLPDNMYTLLNDKVTIKKGERKATVSIAVKPALFDFTYRYGLALSITSSSMGTISSTMRTVIFHISAKNEYDGLYTLKGRLSGVTDRPTLNTTTDFTWPGGKDGGIALITASPNAIDIYDNYYSWGGGINQWINPIGTADDDFSAFGSVRPRITFDNNTHKVISVTNMYPNPTNGRQLSLDQSYDSKYDPDEGTVDVQFIMTQPGYQPLTIHYLFTYVKAR